MNSTTQDKILSVMQGQTQLTSRQIADRVNERYGKQRYPGLAGNLQQMFKKGLLCRTGLSSTYLYWLKK